MLKHKPRPAETGESWYWASGTYIGSFQENLSRIALALEALGLPKLSSEYCPQSKHAQLVTSEKRVAARIRVTGECGAPTNANVTLVNLPPSAEDIFRYNLWPLSVRFTHVTYLRVDAP